MKSLTEKMPFGMAGEDSNYEVICYFIRLSSKQRHGLGSSRAIERKSGPRGRILPSGPCRLLLWPMDCNL